MLVVHIFHVCFGSRLQVSRLCAPISEWRRRQAKNRCVVHVCAIFCAPFWGFAREEGICMQRYLHRSLNGAEDRQKTGVLCMCVRFPCTILGIWTRGSDLHATLLAPISEWR